MARAGSFSRKRSSSNLTSTIFALLRQQQAQEDSDVFDAWQNGGQFKGAKVTDSSLLDYITKRRDGFTKGDADWDKWNNTLQQHSFAIDESKMGLAFKQGKVSAGAMASWYSGQLSKFPQDSEIYRTIAGRAADWAKSASDGARASAGAGVAKALNARLDKDQATVKDYNGIVLAIDQAARRAGLISGSQQVLDTLKPQELTDLLSKGVPDPFTGRIYHFSDWQQSSMATYNALGDQSAVYTQKGDASSAAAASDSQRKFATQTIVGMNALDDRSTYEVAQQIWQSQVSAANGDPHAIKAANDEYVANLARIKENANATGVNPLKGANDPNFVASLDNEANAIATGQVTGPTPNDLSGSGMSDASDKAKGTLDLTNDLNMLDSGQAVVAQKAPGGAYTLMPLPADAANDPNKNLRLGEAYQPATITLPDGTQTTRYLMGQPVQAATLTDQNGDPIGDLKSVTVNGQRVDISTPAALNQAIKAGVVSMGKGTTPIGYVYQTPDGATQYAVRDAKGNRTFTSNNPFTGQRYDSSDWGANVGQVVFVNGVISSQPNANGTTTTIATPNVSQAVTLPDAADQSTDLVFNNWTNPQTRSRGLAGEAATGGQLAAPTGVNPQNYIAYAQQQQQIADLAQPQVSTPTYLTDQQAANIKSVTDQFNPAPLIPVLKLPSFNPASILSAPSLTQPAPSAPSSGPVLPTPAPTTAPKPATSGSGGGGGWGEGDDPASAGGGGGSNYTRGTAGEGAYGGGTYGSGGGGAW